MGGHAPSQLSGSFLLLSQRLILSTPLLSNAPQGRMPGFAYQRLVLSSMIPIAVAGTGKHVMPPESCLMDPTPLPPNHPCRKSPLTRSGYAFILSPGVSLYSLEHFNISCHSCDKSLSTSVETEDYKEPKLIYLTQDKGSHPLTCLFYQKIYSALNFYVRISFLQIIHVLCWTTPLPVIQPVIWSLSCSMSFSVVFVPVFPQSHPVRVFALCSSPALDRMQSVRQPWV